MDEGRGELVDTVTLRGWRSAWMLGGLFMFMGVVLVAVGVLGRGAQLLLFLLTGGAAIAAGYTFGRMLSARHVRRLAFYRAGLGVTRGQREVFFPWAEVQITGDSTALGMQGGLTVELPDRQGFLLLTTNETVESIRKVAARLNELAPRR